MFFVFTALKSTYGTSEENVLNLQLHSDPPAIHIFVFNAMTSSRQVRDASFTCRDTLAVESPFALDPVGRVLFVIERRRRRLWNATLDGCYCNLLLDDADDTGAPTAMFTD